MINPKDSSAMYRLGMMLGEAAKASYGQDYAAPMREVTEFLAIAKKDELGTLFFWLEEGVRNYAESTEQTLKLLRETAEAVGYEHHGRYQSTFFVTP